MNACACMCVCMYCTRVTQTTTTRQSAPVPSTSRPAADRPRDVDRSRSRCRCAARTAPAVARARVISFGRPVHAQAYAAAADPARPPCAPHHQRAPREHHRDRGTARHLEGTLPPMATRVAAFERRWHPRERVRMGRHEQGESRWRRLPSRPSSTTIRERLLAKSIEALATQVHMTSRLWASHYIKHHPGLLAVTVSSQVSESSRRNVCVSKSGAQDGEFYSKIQTNYQRCNRTKEALARTDD